MKNVSGAERPPPGVGVNTVIAARPALATSDELMLARSSLAEMTVVLRALPFQCTTDEVVKLEPSTVSVKALPPVGHAVGELDVSTGTGLLTGGAVTENVALPEVPPPGVGLKTVTVR